MSNQQPKPLFDAKFILAVVLITGMWIAWQSHLKTKYPEAYKPANQATTAEGKATPNSAPGTVDGGKPGTQKEAAAPEVSPRPSQPETVLRHDDDMWAFDISSRGMAVRNVQLKKYTDRENNVVVFASGPDESLFSTLLLDRADDINFQLKKSTENEYIGQAQIDGMQVTKILTVNSELYTFKSLIRVEKVSPAFKGLTVKFTQKIAKQEKQSFFMANFEHQEFFVQYDNTSSNVVVDHESQVSENYSKAHVIGFGSQYFAAGMVDKSAVIPDAKAVAMGGENAKSIGLINYAMLNRTESFAVEYLAYVGPKSYNVLKAVDADLSNLVNFGFFTSIAKGLFWLMTTIQAAVSNWGLAIILLTILVRMIVLPFNVMGYRQMKAMAKIQPELKILREKYKNDTAKLNQEMLQLMKDAKANPLAGCLPMLIQIPIFFALYQVIGQSIELYKEPFMFWIHDLSAKDPFYVLPVLMGATMFLQFKITPSTMEPAQQKIMMFMPIFFTFLMLSLPSGLTLYMFVSSLFAIIQQLYFMKEKPASMPKAYA